MGGTAIPSPQDNLSVYWKFRVGDYRLIAEIIDEWVIVLMLVVAHRRAAHQAWGEMPYAPSKSHCLQ